MKGYNDSKRVKVYQLVDKKWDDFAVGYVVIEVSGRTFLKSICVYSESGEVVFESVIDVNDMYQRQLDTLIVWNEHCVDDVEYALSFRVVEGCEQIWNELKAIQSDIVSGNEVHEDSDELPDCEECELEDILEFVESYKTANEKTYLARLILSQEEFIFNLILVSQDRTKLSEKILLFNIFCRIVMLNSEELIELILSDKYIFEIMAIFEDDPDHKGSQKHSHYLREKVIFVEVIPLPHNTVQKIHLSYRIQYLREVVLYQVLEDGTSKLLNMMFTMNNLNIVYTLTKSEELYNNLFEMIKTSQPQEIVQIFTFICELSEMTVNLDQQKKTQYFRNLVSRGIFKVLEVSLQHEDVLLRLHSSKLLVLLSEFDPNLLRLQVVEGSDILSIAIDQYFSDPDTGVKNYLIDVLQHTIHTFSCSIEKEVFLDVFYSNFFERLVAPLINLPCIISDENFVKNSLCNLISSLLLSDHRDLLIEKIKEVDMIKKIAPLLKSKENYLRLACIRIIKELIDSDDDVIQSSINTPEVMGLIISVFVANGKKNNLLSSALLDFFHKILLGNLKSVTKYILANYYDSIRNIKHTNIFEQIKEQDLEARQEKSFCVSGGKRFRDEGDSSPHKRKRIFQDENSM